MKTFKWVVEFEVSEDWIADGFNLDQNRATDMIATALPFANSTEFKATILKAPFATLINKIQGYAE